MLSLICLLILKIHRQQFLKSGRKRVRLLIAYLADYIARLSRVLSSAGVYSQIDRLSIRQALASLLFGRGLLHS